ncbi:MAG: MG2 domain-containing protein [Treponema sp.]|nr:MG2 domain-containing protein [Treponema sp.]
MMRKVLSILFISLFIFMATGCPEKKTVPVVENTSVKQESVPVVPVISSKVNTKEAAHRAFTLDYTPETPEPQKGPGKINMSAGTSSGSSSGTEKNESVVPGLRKLDDYKTKYYTSKLVNGKKNSAAQDEKLDPAKAPKEPFTITDWGPNGGIPADVKCPSFYVLFSEPVVPLKALDDPMTSSDLMEITPKLKGVFRWYGTSLLSFDATEAADPLVTYKIKVSDKVTSMYGKKLEGQKVFETEAQELKIEQFYPGYSYKRLAMTWFDKDDVPFEAAKECRVTFNYDVTASMIQELSNVTVGTNKVTFTVTQETPDTVTFNINTPKKINDYEEIKITTFQPNGKNGNSCVAKYNVLKPFKVSRVSDGETNNRYSNPVYINFSHMVDEKTVLGNIKTVPEMPVTKENIKVTGTSVTVFNLPVTFGEKYKIFVGEGVQDIYGRSLSKESVTTITVPDAASEVNFQNRGFKILESKFPHKMVFDYQNVRDGSYYALAKTKRPFSYDYRPDGESLTFDLALEPKNTRLMEAVDFDKVLDGGNGWITFEADVNLWNRRSEKTYKRESNVTVQVTDLGVTVRYGINKIVAFVTKLSDGSPVSGADVYWFDRDNEISLDSMISSAVANGKTDENGLAVIDTELRTVDSPAILVVKEDDKVAFSPSSHSPWRNGIYNTSNYRFASNSEQYTFMFCDRGLYKPGETISIRGIDRDLLFGEYTPWEGNYSISLKEDSWYRPKVISTKYGTTSASGGFTETFDVPEDIEPGNYKIEYERSGSNAKRSITVNIAYFERLKFQSSIVIPNVPLTTGDSVSGTLSASYLAGGALSGADYSSSWFAEPWYFETDDVEFKGFRFGPIDTNGSRRSISHDNGVLSADGEAKLSVTAMPGDLKGVPYRYRVSADVTDTSNMSISTQAAAVVHPALYYIGIGRPSGIAGFAKAGQSITYPYKVADLQGTPVLKAENPSKLISSLAGENKNLTVTLSRENWTLVQQNGLYGGVYTRYERSYEVEDTKTIPLSAEGKIEVKPSKVGNYVLKVEGVDARGREVLSEYRFFVTGKGSYSWRQEDATSIRLTPDQNKYNPGDTAHILMESTLPNGNYLITVEREGIFTEEIKHFEDGVAVFDVPVSKNYVPVVYVSISSYSIRNGDPVHKYGEVDLDKPKGYYGITELFIDPYVKAFSIDVKSEKTAYRPGEEATVTLTATRGGKPVPNAELTLMAVDRGVLDLINYHVPNPIEFFYSKNNFPLRCYGGDSRAYLMDPVTYEVKNLQGGDEGSDDKLQERSDFNPTAVFEPVLVTDENGQVTCKFKLPDTLTTYRVTAFGVCGDLLALQEDEIGVRNPVNVQQVLPRRLRERDTAELGVLLTNLDNVPHKMKVALELKTPEQSEIASEGGLAKRPGRCFVDGAAEHEVTVQPGQNVTVYFDAAATKAGIVNVVFTVTSDVLNERIKVPMVVEKPYLYETFTTMGTVGSDETSGSEGMIIPESVDDMGGLTVTLDATRLGALGESVNYVFNYPYGCMEQQSSRILPLVIFEEYIDVFGLEKDSKIEDVRTLVKSYFKQWKNVQHKNGGFPYWPSDSRYENFYVSLRLAHIAALAKERGYSDSDIAYNVPNLMTYLENTINNPRIHCSDYEEAMYYYIRSLFGMDVSKNKLEAIYATNTDISVTALVGMTYLNMNGMDSEFSEKCRARIRTYMRPGTRGVDISQDSSWWRSWYNTNDERMALALQFFVQMDKDDEMVTRLIWSLMQNQKAGYWQSTATTSKVLEAFYTVIKKSDLDNLNQTSKAKIGGKELVSGMFKGPAAKPVTVTVPFTDPRLSSLDKDKLQSLDFEKEGNGSLYYTASLKYAIPYENQNARDEGLGLSYVLTDIITGEEIKPAAGSTRIELESGRIYSVKVKLSTSRDRQFIAMRAPIPSGAEILDSTFVTSPEESYSGTSYDNDNHYDWGHWMSNQAIYDNEIQFFWDRFRKGSTTAEFKFRAVRRGVFPVPPVTAECMYEPEVFGRTNGLLYTIK